MVLIFEKGILVTSKRITTKNHKEIQINTIMDESGGSVTLVGDAVWIDEKVPKMLPMRIESQVTVSNYNGVSFQIDKFHAEPMKV